MVASLHVDRRLLDDDGLPGEGERGRRGRGRHDGRADGAGGRGHEGGDGGGAHRGQDGVGEDELRVGVRLGLGPTAPSAQDEQEEEWQGAPHLEEPLSAVT